MQAWIRWMKDEEATGRLAEFYAAARDRAGKVFNIVRVMSQNPPVLDSAVTAYLRIMKGRSPLGRAQREMLATLVSHLNGCHY